MDDVETLKTLLAQANARITQLEGALRQQQLETVCECKNCMYAFDVLDASAKFARTQQEIVNDHKKYWCD